jgi:translocation and assembly module TamB
VTFGSDGTSEIQLNYEIKKDFTARGSFDNEGNTGIGIHFERDY